MSETWKPIRVFISSTFLDMQADRNYLVKQIFPQLRKLCESRGVIWGEVDLRWGIPDEDRDDVLPLCLEEIHRCHPYFIGLLGERYGYVPETIEEELFAWQPWLREHQGKSITELEILHGVLRDPAMSGHAFFYFRDPAYLKQLPEKDRQAFRCETEEDAEKLACLKAAIRQATTAEICALREPYTDPTQLGQFILDDFTALINRLFPEHEAPDPVSRERLAHDLIAQSQARAYIGRQAYFDRLDAHVAGDGPPLVVLGESGIGKSALLANWFTTRFHPELGVRYPVTGNQPLHVDFFLIHFIGATQNSTDPLQVLRRILCELQQRFPDRLPREVPEQPASLREAFPQWLALVAETHRLVLVLDGLNQLDDQESTQVLGWLPEAFPPNCRVILSTLPGRNLDATRQRHWPEMTVEPLYITERMQLLWRFLRLYRKRLNKTTRRRIVAAEQTANPLFLRAMLDELRQYGDNTRLNERIDYYLSAQGPKELYDRILRRWEDDYGSALVRDSLSLIWAARRGMAESELLDLLGEDDSPLPQAKWAPFFLAADSSLAKRSGLLYFFHDFIRQAVRDAYLSSEGQQRKMHERLADYFQERVVTYRTLEELPWQLAEAQEWLRLAEILGHPQLLGRLFRYNTVDTKRYWQSIETETRLRMPEVYQQVIDTPGAYADAALSISDLLDETGYPDEAIRLLTGLAAYCAEQQDDAGLAFAALTRLGLLLRKSGRHEEALARFEECEALLQHAALDNAEASVILNKATVYECRGDLERAAAETAKAEQLYRQGTSQFGLCRCLLSQVSIYITLGDFARVEALLDEAQRIAQALGLDEQLILVKLDRANLCFKRGDLAGSEALLCEVEPFYTRLGDLSNQAYIQLLFGLIAKMRGDYQQALRSHQRAAELHQRLNAPRSYAAALGNQVEVLIHLNRHAEARPLNEESIAIFRRLNDKEGLAVSLVNQAIILTRLGESEAGAQHALEGVELSREMHFTENIAHGLACLASFAESRQQHKEAKAYYDQAIAAFTEAHAQAGLAAVFLGRGRLLFTAFDQRMAALADFEQAIDLGQQFGFTAILKQVFLFVATQYRLQSELPFALQAAQAWEQLVAEDGEPADRIRVQLVTAEILVNQGQFAEAGEKYRCALALAETLGDEVLLVSTLLNQGFCLRANGEPEAALAAIDRGLVLARRHDLWSDIAQGLLLREKILRFDLFREAEAVEAFREAEELAIRHQLDRALAQIQSRQSLKANP